MVYTLFARHTESREWVDSSLESRKWLQDLISKSKRSLKPGGLRLQACELPKLTRLVGIMVSKMFRQPRKSSVLPPFITGPKLHPYLLCTYYVHRLYPHASPPGFMSAWLGSERVPAMSRSEKSQTTCDLSASAIQFFRVLKYLTCLNPLKKASTAHHSHLSTTFWAKRKSSSILKRLQIIIAQTIIKLQPSACTNKQRSNTPPNYGIVAHEENCRCGL